MNRRCDVRTKKAITALCLLCSCQVVFGAIRVKIAKIRGEVKVRRGAEETWQRASAGTWLEEMDSILTGKRGQVILEAQAGKTFKLGRNTILDIADLRRISERELFLFLMSCKLERIGLRERKTKLSIQEVKGEEAELEADSLAAVARANHEHDWLREKNGAIALYAQDYPTNAVVKLNKILLRYPEVRDCGEIHYYLGQAFEALEKPGQAAEAYQQVQTRSQFDYCEQPWIEEAARALQRSRDNVSTGNFAQ